jgi:hypothetical protein
LEVCIKEEYIYLGEWGLVFVGLLPPLVPLFVQTLTRTVEKILCTNGHNFPLFGKLTYTFTPSLEVCKKKEHIYLGERGLVFVGFLQPMFPLFVQILTRTVETILCTNGRNFPLIGKITYTFTPSFGSM